MWRVYLTDYSFTLVLPVSSPFSLPRLSAASSLKLGNGATKSLTHGQRSRRRRSRQRELFPRRRSSIRASVPSAANLGDVALVRVVYVGQSQDGHEEAMNAYVLVRFCDYRLPASHLSRRTHCSSVIIATLLQASVRLTSSAVIMNHLIPMHNEARVRHDP